jgi:hypothetical protein
MPAGEFLCGRTVRRAVQAIAAAFVTYTVAVQAIAASNSHSFTVGANVIASCAIVPQRLGLQSAAPCAVAPNALSVPTPRPVMRFTYDPAAKIKTVTLEF